jgi:uncharacterized protein YbaR (Trm112 family)
LKLGRRFSLQAPNASDLLEETQRFREHLALLACPSCAEKALKLVNYVQGPTGWGCGFFCTSCNSKGELNSDGFRVELTEAKKEPKEEEPKTKQRKEIKK